jgi:hypothetical protein
MFGRARNFGTVNRDLFPEASGGGRKFGELAAIVASIEEQLVRREQARTEGRALRAEPKNAAFEAMRAVASTGRRAVTDEPMPHAFRMPRRRSATATLTTARLFRTEAEQRKEKFVELGMPPTFLEDFDRAIAGLEAAVELRHDSRGARQLANTAIEMAINRGMAVVADLDVAVRNTLAADPARRAQWAAARRVDPQPSAGTARPAQPAPGTASGPLTPAEADKGGATPAAPRDTTPFSFAS